MIDHLIHCQACGFLGHKRRQRARQTARVADAGHIAWARQLADESRRRRARPDGLIATLDCRVLGVGPAELVPRETLSRSAEEIRRLFQ